MGKIVDFRSPPSTDKQIPEGPAPIPAANEPPLGDGTLDEAITKAMALQETELLPAVGLALELASEADQQQDKTSFYTYIMASHAITLRILLSGGRL